MVQNAGLRMLRSFNKQNVRTFVELCKEAGYPTDLGGYYLRQLLQSDYLEKGERGQYILMPKGRRYLATNAVDKLPSVRPHVLVVPQFEKHYVVVERNKQPFLRRKEWPATRIKAGESKDDTLNRLLHERLAPAENITFKGVFRRIDIYDGELFDDKLFFVHSANLLEKPVSEVTNGENLMIDMKGLSVISNKSRSLLDIKSFLEADEKYIEMQYQLNYEDFEPSS